MSETLVKAEDVSLVALLEAKERRAHRQQEWLVKHRQPVLSLTLVTPGPIKDGIRYRNCMAVALQACDQLLWGNRWPVLERQVLWLPTGAEAMWSVAHSASELKAATVGLEQTHPLGQAVGCGCDLPRQWPGRADFAGFGGPALPGV